MNDQQIDPELVINDLLDRNKELTLQISVLRAAYKQLQDSVAKNGTEPAPEAKGKK